MQLTKERAITLHRRMWRWIGLKTLKEKRCVKDEEWFERFRLERIHYICYCCEYASQFLFFLYLNNISRVFASGGSTCNFCPIDCGGKKHRSDKQALFELWRYAIARNNWQEAGKLALQIAELPERKRF